MSSCSDLPTRISATGLAAFREADISILSKRGIDKTTMRAFDGGGCAARTEDGVTTGYDGKCMDIGEPFQVGPAADGLYGHTPLRFLPALNKPGTEDLKQHARRLQEAISSLQFPSDGKPQCQIDRVYYMHDLPQVGFGSIIEYATMFLGRSLSIGARTKPSREDRAAHVHSHHNSFSPAHVAHCPPARSSTGTQFRIGPNSSMAWTSEWHCGPQRSLLCYFQLSSCCAPVLAPGEGLRVRPLMLPRRRDPINVAASGFNEYGSAWVSAQLVRFLFERLTPHTRREIVRRRFGVLPPRLGYSRGPGGGGIDGDGGAHTSWPLTIGMHVRGGDSCHKGRYCPQNLTATYFAEAAKLRTIYGANRILLATDNQEAARLCREGVLGFDCHTQAIERTKFEAAELIENRVAQHSEGGLSGSAVALDALADIDMLGDCDLFVLLLRSCMARVAYALAVGRQSRPLPVISLEAPWSPYKGFKMANFKMLRRGMGRGSGGRGRGARGRGRRGRAGGW